MWPTRRLAGQIADKKKWFMLTDAGYLRLQINTQDK